MGRATSARGRAALLLLALCGACAHNELADIDAPALSLTDVGGARISLSSYRGQVVLVSFFATWCFFCLGDIPRLEELQETRSKDGLQVLAIGLDREGVQVLEPFRKFYKLSFPVLVGADRFAHEGLPFAPVKVLPTTYVVGRDGTVLEKWEGILPRKLLDEVIDKALRRR